MLRLLGGLRNEIGGIEQLQLLGNVVSSSKVVEEGPVFLLTEQGSTDRGPQGPQVQAVAGVEVVQCQPRGRDARGRGSLVGKTTQVLKDKIPRYPHTQPPSTQLACFPGRTQHRVLCCQKSTRPFQSVSVTGPKGMA